MKQNTSSRYAMPLIHGRKNDFSIQMIEYLIDAQPQAVNDILSAHDLKIKAVSDRRMFVLVPDNH